MSSPNDQRDSSVENTTPRAKLYDIGPAMKLVYRSSPSYSFSPKNQYGAFYTYDRTPGPQYTMPKIDCSKQRAPQYSMTFRRYTKFTSPLDDEYKQ